MAALEARFEESVSDFPAPFNKMGTLKFKDQLTNAFFATVNQMFIGSSQRPTVLP